MSDAFLDGHLNSVLGAFNEARAAEADPAHSVPDASQFPKPGEAGGGADLSEVIEHMTQTGFERLGLVADIGEQVISITGNGEEERY